jgi:NDP-sugar pyrophosphorylase family protein
MGKSDLKAMIMAAGVGSRLEPLTKHLPKPLVPVLNRPVMDILLEKLAGIGVTEVIANTFYHAGQIMEHYGSAVSYVKEKTLSGTAGGLKKCQFFFTPGRDLIVLSGDGLTNADLEKGIGVHKTSGAIATIGVKRIPRSEIPNFGVVVTDNEGYITEFQEKPSLEQAKSDCINTGIYIFNYKIFDFIPENTFYDFAKNVFPRLLELRQINTFEVSEYWNDIGTLEQYKQSTKDVFNGLCEFEHAPIVRSTGGAYVSGSPVPESVRFAGNSTIGSGCRIGENVVLENCIIWDNVVIADGVRLSDCIISSNNSVTQNCTGLIF